MSAAERPLPFPVRRAIYHPEPGGYRRLKSGLLIGLLLVVSALLQSQLPSALGKGNFRPDLVLIAAVFWSLRAAGWSWVPVALGAGVLLDVFSASRPGLGMIEVLAVCALVVLVTRPLLRDSRRLVFVAVAASALVSSLIYYLLLILFSSPPAPAAAWTGAIWPHLWQTVLVSPFWIWVCALILDEGKKPDRRNWG